MNDPNRRDRCAGWRVLVLALLVTGGAYSSDAGACDTDTDCGPGGTCIKREKRARGVCYGRADERTTDHAGDVPAAAGAAPGVSPAPVSGQLRERATRWLGDPEQRIRDAVPNAELGGVCIVSSDCPDGWDCIVAGFEGRCVRQ